MVFFILAAPYLLLVRPATKSCTFFIVAKEVGVAQTDCQQSGLVVAI
jgi:hypothetical protein